MLVPLPRHQAILLPYRPTGEPSAADSSSGTMLLSRLGLTAFMFKPHGALVSLAVAASFLTSGVYGDSHGAACSPTLTIEISMPPAAAVTEKHGETDHYLSATVNTVTWGYYDPEATAVISMESGETITVEGMLLVCLELHCTRRDCLTAQSSSFLHSHYPSFRP